MALGRTIKGLNESRKEELMEQENSRSKMTERLVEKWGKKQNLGLDNGKMASLYEENPRKAGNLALMLENTQRGLTQLNEYQTSGFLGITPQEIVKVVRIGYPNSIMHEVFDVWGMESVKDTFFKLETTYGSTKRGATAGDITYETYNDGRYPSEYEKETTVGTGDTNYTGTLAIAPLRPYHAKVYIDNSLVAQDNGMGQFVGEGVSQGTPSTIDYTTGDYDITFADPVAITSEFDIEYAYDSEIESLFPEQGTVLLNLVAYDFRAIFWSLNYAWSRMTQEIMDSKLKESAREVLVTAAGELMKKSFDEYSIRHGISASRWVAPEQFDTDFANAGSDSDYAHAQSVLGTIQNAELNTYEALGRLAPMSNLIVGTKALTYLKKHNKFNSENSQARIGIFRVGELDGRGVYMAPPTVVEDNKIYIFGKGADSMSTDSVVSIGTWKVGMQADELTFKNFNTEGALGAMMDFRVNEKKMSSSVELLNL